MDNTYLVGREKVREYARAVQGLCSGQSVTYHGESLLLRWAERTVPVLGSTVTVGTATGDKQVFSRADAGPPGLKALEAGVQAASAQVRFGP